MNCPACKVELRLADRQGVEIGYCPQCRGVWLDRRRIRQHHYGKKKKSFLGEMFDFD